MFGIGVTEIILILIVALVIVGPEKLPDLVKSLAKGFNEFKRTTNDLKRSIEWDSAPNRRKARASSDSTDEKASEEGRGVESAVGEKTEKPTKPTKIVKEPLKKTKPKRKPTPKKSVTKKSNTKKSAPKKKSSVKKEEGTS